jgi:CDP-diacylglycerol--glycerol-3-phosphate 3-phosphatidyltransferase
MQYITFATYLTLIRLIVSPLVLPFLLAYLLPFNVPILNVLLAICFLALAFTDFLDGYYARKYNQTSRIGAALDHIADKFLTSSALIALLAAGKICFYWVIMFIGRDLFIMGLRQISLEEGFPLPVDYLGKIKTASLILLITWIILDPYQHNAYPGSLFWQQTELILLTASLIFSFLSAFSYLRSFIGTIHQHPQLKNPATKND